MQTKKAMYNFITAFIPWIILAVLGFIKLKFFIDIFGSELNGLVQLVSQIYAYLAMAELGFASAISFKLYKPLAENDREKVSELFNGAQKLFKKVGLFIFIGGIIASVILPLVLPNSTISWQYIMAVTFLYSIDYFTDYVFAVPYRLLLTADQKMYKINIVTNIKNVVFKSLELTLIIMGFDLLIIIILGITMNIISNMILIKMIKKEYQWINKKAKPDTSAKYMSKDILIHKISNIVTDRTASIVISIVLGLVTNSIYGAYNYIMTYIHQMITLLLHAPKDAFGHLFSNDKISIEEKYNTYMEYLIGTYFICTIILIPFIISANSFVVLWLGIEYKVSFVTVVLFAAVLGNNIIIKPVHVAMSTKGLFKETKKYALLQATLSLTLSIILVFKFGIPGVLIASAVTTFIIIIPFEMKIIYEKIFDRGIKDFLRLNMAVLVLIVTTVCSFRFLNQVYNFYSPSTIINWFLTTGIITLIIVLLVYLIFYSSSNNFKRLQKRLLKNLKIKFKKSGVAV